MRGMTIKEFSNLCGCNPQTIRYYDEFSDLNDSQEYMLLFELASDKSNWTGFANTILGMLILKNKVRKRKLDCKINSSKDGNNHFWLLIRKNDEAGK